MSENARQLEAIFEGKEEETIKFLSKHHFFAIIIFIFAIVTANLWGEVVINISTKIYGVKREDLKLWQMILTATVFTLVAYIIIIYIIKVPITSAFSL